MVKGYNFVFISKYKTLRSSKKPKRLKSFLSSITGNWRVKKTEKVSK
jgi:hypothetical protein